MILLIYVHKNWFVASRYIETNLDWTLSPLRIGRPHHPTIRSGHLDIKDAQWAENKDGRKILISHHIAFGRHGRPKGASWAPKNVMPIFIFSSLCIFYINMATTEEGGVCITSVGKNFPVFIHLFSNRSLSFS